MNIVRNSILLAMMAQFAWPMKITETFSRSKGRWVIRDSNNEQFGVLYDVTQAQAQAIALGLNSFYEQVLRDAAEAIKAKEAKAREHNEKVQKAFVELLGLLGMVADGSAINGKSTDF